MGGSNTFNKIVLLNEIIFCTTSPGAILTSSPAHIPGKVDGMSSVVDWREGGKGGRTCEESDDGLVHRTNAFDFEVVRYEEGEDEENENLQRGGFVSLCSERRDGGDLGRWLHRAPTSSAQRNTPTIEPPKVF